uniref:Uncharacterized protein n=1 Tax=Vespula pensylvanica TaxID=30213 RepID=A0A834P1Q4_VESPE|nr:hypothetical protein H0235_007735 [Vespula pensylvanica]
MVVMVVVMGSLGFHLAKRGVGRSSAAFASGVESNAVKDQNDEQTVLKLVALGQNEAEVGCREKEGKKEKTNGSKQQQRDLNVKNMQRFNGERTFYFRMHKRETFSGNKFGQALKDCYYCILMRQLNGGVIIPAVLWLSEKISGLQSVQGGLGQTIFSPIMATFENTSETTDEPAGILIYAREMACALGAYLD